MDRIGSKIRIGMLASGRGTNVANFIEYFRLHDLIEIALVVSDNPDAQVLKRAAKTKIPHVLVRRDQWADPALVLGLFSENQIDFVVLAGFLFKVPKFLLDSYPNRIVNIHPALLPKYGGKGMFGLRVHEAVLSNGENESGISIHYVNEFYDEGPVIFQARCPVLKDDTPESLANRVQQLEYQHYPKVVEQLVLKDII
ncbi:MAG TPA: phosphoribosylglycinamide formyltransferase [Bacteroidales bacterium]|nr:phosphoribosylglycinamide formyltransferase [Bacteroidales bacterium]